MNDLPPATNTPIEIDVRAVKELMDSQEDYLLVDCREPAEHSFCRIAGNVLIPMNETPDRIAELESYRDRPIVIYCHLGIRSLQVANWLRVEGFKRSCSMSGGIEAWSRQIDAEVPRY